MGDSAVHVVTTPGEEIVGVVVQGQELGPIVFTDLFIERFPKLRQVTVVREATHQYVYRAGAPKTTFAEAAALPRTFGTKKIDFLEMAITSQS